MKLGHVIATERKLKNISGKQMAEALGIGFSYLSQIENNARKPSIPLLLSIAQYLEMKVSDLLFLCISDELSLEQKEQYAKVQPMFDDMLAIIFKTTV